MKKVLLIFLAVLLTMCLMTACGGGQDEPVADEPEQPVEPADVEQPADSPYPALPADGPEFSIILGTSGSEDSVNSKSCHYLKDILETYSNGKFVVNVYNNNQLGTERETLEGVQTGNITMTLVSTSVVVPFIPETGIFDLPRLFPSREVCLEVLNEGSLAQEMVGLHEEQNFKLLGYYPNAFRQMSSNVEIHSLEDFKDVRVRTMENEYQMAFFTALGATPVPLAVTEVYTALQQGLCDGTENPYNSIFALGWHEQQKYMIEYDSNMFISEYIMNKEFYDNMPAEYQEFLDAVMKDVMVESASIGKQLDDEYKQILADFGCQIIEFDEAIKDAMKEQCSSVYDLARQNLGDAIVDMAVDSVAAAQ